MALTTDRPAAPRALRLAWILLIVVALVVAAAGIAVVGARLLNRPRRSRSAARP